MAKKKVVKKQAKEQPQRLFRSKENKIIAGVCGGIAEYFKIDPVIIRLIWVLLVLGYGFGILAYLIAWLIIPLRK
jgi:phage shock protein C